MKPTTLISKRKIISALFILALLLSACAPAAMAPSRERELMDAGQPVLVEAPAEAVFEEKQSVLGDTSQSGAAQTDRLVIKNASLSIVVDDSSSAVDRISRMAEEMGGFVVSANLYQSELENGIQVWRASITIRVPAEKLNDALEQIKSESDQDPINENVTSQDVTSEYTDLQSRLRNLESAEEQLSRIMESAVKTEDVLNVYNQLVQIREQIEVTKGQIKYYEQSADMSAISVELIPNEAVQPLTIGGWQPVGVAKDSIQTLLDILNIIVNLFIRIIIIVLPTLLVLYVIFVLPVVLIVRALRRRRARQKEAALAQKTSE